MTKANEELIAIAIPVYNVEQYLEECLDSVINQTYQNWVCVLVDDSSSDSSGKICDEYAKKDSRFHVIHKGENEGLPYARQTGANYARQTGAKYITFIDSDDFVDKRYLEVLYKNMIEHDADLSIIQFQRFVNKDDIETSYKVGQITTGQTQLDVVKIMIPNASTIYCVNTWACLFKIDLIEDMDWDYNDNNGNPRGEDQRFRLQYSLKAKSYVHQNLPLYFYRYNPNSIMIKDRMISTINDVDVCKNVGEFYKERANYDFSEYIDAEVFNKLLIPVNLVCDCKKFRGNDLQAKNMIAKYKDLKIPPTLQKKQRIALFILFKFPFPVYKFIRKICLSLHLVEFTGEGL